MALELFLDMFSQPCRSVYMFAKKNNILVEVRTVSLMNGEQFTEEFGKVNPIRKVPALKDGDFSMGESIAMMQYMAEKFKTPDHWYPADLQKRARVNEYLCWQPTGIRMHGSKIFWLKVMLPTVFKIDVPKEKMEGALEDLDSSLKVIEDAFIQDRAFIAGEQISMADLVAVVEIMQPFAAGVDVFKDRPKLLAWKERVVQAVGKELFDEAHEKILNAREAVKLVDSSKMEAFRPRVIRLML
ncbi:glutathione S-transferase theta-1b [Boleophthalmus pectinirostris]|uniref:glutathione S-transferase theta-1b n=1 Tax=Boleophthalmus pectinirostris TaxID=150288 RepID=UPI000A1C24D5|nr:glutathione S-transferase theta-1b [Boleophthalmus pectinirostris]